MPNTNPCTEIDIPLRKGYPCINFIPPHGRRQETEFRNMRQEDYDWMESKDAKLSCEQQGPNFVVYLDVGLTYDNDSDEDPNEAIFIAHPGCSPFDAISELVKCAKEMLECA